MGHAVCFVDAGCRILYWNSAAEQLTGYSSADVIGHHCFDDRSGQPDRTGCPLCHRECPLARALEQGQSVSERHFVRHRSGRRISIEARATPVRNDDGTIIGCVEVFQDATSSVVVENAYRQVREAADRDPLTGLANRRFLNRELERHLRERERSQQPFSVIMADLDRFKEINDTFGHMVGDQVLVKVAACLQNQCRPVDLVARFGGEEFVVLLPHEKVETAAHVAERLRQSIVMAAGDDLGQRASHGQLRSGPGRLRRFGPRVAAASRHSALQGQVAGARQGRNRAARPKSVKSSRDGETARRKAKRCVGTGPIPEQATWDQAQGPNGKNPAPRSRAAASAAGSLVFAYLTFFLADLRTTAAPRACACDAPAFLGRAARALGRAPPSGRSDAEGFADRIVFD